MESQPQNPEFRNNPENFHPCVRMKFRLCKRIRTNLQISLNGHCINIINKCCTLLKQGIHFIFNHTH